MDDAEASAPVLEDVNFPLAVGVDRDIADRLGAWWDEKRGIIQPSEFLLMRDGRIAHATYSTGPIGRIEPRDALSMIRVLNERRRDRDG